MTVGTKQEAEARGHHYVPKCWLAGFTETGENDGRLWVTDFSRQSQWASTPEKSGKIRDFYRLTDPELDPLLVENALSKIEAEVGPLLKSLDRERRGPNADELDALLQFMAVQWARVPSFRPFALGILGSITKQGLEAALTNDETWVASLKEAGIAPDTPGADYDACKAFFESGEYNLTAETDWYMCRAFRAAEAIIPKLRERHWGAEFSPNGRYIGSDSPVVMDGPKGEKVGFKNAEVVLYPVSRHVLLRGTPAPVNHPPVKLTHIAAMNTMMLLCADSQVYSHVPDFSWLDEKFKHQTDWRLFSKDNFHGLKSPEG